METLAPALPAPDDAWAAVLVRSRAADGSFVFAVRTTGVYCRPSCPARRPKRANVAFFAGPAEAAHAGFRPCRRCRPDGQTAGQAAVARAQAYLDARTDTRVGLAELAEAVGLSAGHLQRVFTRAVGLSPRRYQDAHRLATFKSAVRAGATVLEAQLDAGFASSRSLYERAGDGLGMTPGQYRRGGRGQHVRYTVAPSPLGLVLVAATARGVCALALGDGEAALEAELRAEFPEATVERDDAALAPWAEGVLDYLAGERPHPAVALDLGGSDFQRRVWAALQAIPPGETRTYAEVAAALGRPTATRAVARACATNRVGLVVPCHRVVPAAGGVGGYRWGPERKRALLAMESRRGS